MSHNWFGSLKRAPRTRECPSGYLAVWSGPAKTGVRCLIAGSELRGGPIRTFGRTVQNRTGQPVQVADQQQVISTMVGSESLLELSDSRALTLCELSDIGPPADWLGNARDDDLRASSTDVPRPARPAG